MSSDGVFWLVLLMWAAFAAAWIMSKPGFWIIALGIGSLALAIGGLASAFATLASIIHFQIGGALLFFFLMLACWAGMDEVERQSERERRDEHWAAIKAKDKQA